MDAKAHRHFRKQKNRLNAIISITSLTLHKDYHIIKCEKRNQFHMNNKCHSHIREI